MSETLVNQLKTIMAEELDVNLKVEDIDENASLFEDGMGLDSIAIVELISLVEEHFGFQFSDTELTPESFSNLSMLADFISGKLSSQRIEAVSQST
jgi:acyl carrier protein